MDILDIAIVKQLAGGGGGSGTDNYNDLSNLPKINDVTLSGNKSSSALGLQSEITSENKLDSDLIDDTDQDNKFVTSSEKNIWNAKQNAIDADHKLNADYVDDSTSTNKFVTASDKEAWNAKQNAIDNSHKLSSDLVDDANHTNKFVTSTEKNTWNGKQNAIDSEHKLSSSLVSFTTAEAAALASGIDSTKVAQISTNQSNIWYAINNGATNQFFILNGYYQLSSVASVTADNGALTFSNSVTYTSSAEIGKITLKAGTYVLTNRYVKVGGSIYGDIRLMDGETNLTSGEVAEFTIGTDKTLSLMAYVYTGSLSNPVTIKPLLYEKELWDQKTDYMPPALPNYDLTYLEAQDRAALAEEIDAGAKNLLDTSTTTVSNITFTQDSNSYITASPNNADTRSWNYANTQYKLNLKAGTYVFAMDIKTATSNNGIGFNLYSSNGTSIIHSETSEILNKTGMVTWQFTITTEGTYGVIFKCFDMVARLMVCTKAAFGVSSKYVPYRVPITGLTAVNRSIACSTTETSTGIKFVSTKTAMYKITVTAHYGASKPLSLRIKQKINTSASQYPFVVVESTDNSIALTATGIMTLGVGGEFEIFTTYASAANNNIYMLVEELG